MSNTPEDDGLPDDESTEVPFIPKELSEELRRLEAFEQMRGEYQLFTLLALGGLIWLMRWLFGAPEGFLGHLGQMLLFAVVAMVMTVAVESRIARPTHGTSGALGASIMWLLASAVVLVISIVVAGIFAIAGVSDWIGTMNLVAEIIFAILALLLIVEI